MASLDRHRTDQLLRLLQRFEPVCLVGAARSGLTELSRDLVRSAAQRQGATLRIIDGGNVQDPDSLVRQLLDAPTSQAALPVPVSKTSPASVARILADVESKFHVLLNNAHQIPEPVLFDVIRLCGALRVSSESRARDSGTAVMVEGALDLKSIAKHFVQSAHGADSFPKRVDSDSPSPQDVSAHIEDHLWDRGIHATWAERSAICDLVGSDLGFLADLLEALPAGQALDDVALREASVEVVRFGATARSIRHSIDRLVDSEFDVLCRLSEG